MKRFQAKSAAQIEIIPALMEEQPVLANLLQLYAHDFSEFHEVEMGADGRFEYRQLPLYWTEPGRHPFLVWVEGKLAGFVLVKRGSEISGDAGIWDMAEFFVIRAQRRRGIGSRVAQEVWQRFPGRWEVRVLEANGAAREFWGRAIASWTGRALAPMRVELEGSRWDVFSFECGDSSKRKPKDFNRRGREEKPRSTRRNSS